MNSQSTASNIVNGSIHFGDYFWSNIGRIFQLIIHSLSFSFTYLVIVVVLGSMILLIRRILILKKILKTKTVLLEITPPAFTDKGALTTQNFFSVIYGLKPEFNFTNYLTGKKTIFSLEIVSTLNQGIRYLIRATPDEAEIIKKDFLAYLPQAKIKEVLEYLPNKEQLKGKHSKVIEFKQRKHFAYPLQKHEILTEHDPVAYITGMMTKLSPGDFVSLQMVIAPTIIGETDYIDDLIRKNGNVLGYLNRFRYPNIFKPAVLLYKILIKLAYGFGDNFITYGLGSIVNNQKTNNKPQLAYSNYQYYQQVQVQQKLKPERILSTFEADTIQSIQEKINQHIFEVTLRTMVIVSNKKDLNDKIRGINSSLSSFSVPRYQSLKKKWDFPWFLINQVREFSFRNRLLSLSTKSSTILSSSEISSLYHFPYKDAAQTENLIRSYSNELSAPLSLKQGKQYDVIIGQNIYGGTLTSIGLTEEDREKHKFMIGGTGMGKTTMIVGELIQDIKKGRGVCFIDPHGDAAELIISALPESRINEFIYWDPDDFDCPIRFNPLELTKGLSKNDLEREMELKEGALISWFHKSFRGTNIIDTHRIDYILQNTIYTAFTIKDATLFTLFDILNNSAYRTEVVNNLENQRLKDFWINEFGQAGDYQRVKMAAGVTSKLGQFMFSPSIKRVFEDPHSTINFDEIMNTGKILICQFAKGKINEVNSELLGTMVLNQLQIAAQKRARIPESKRKEFYIYVDEFQNFATESFAQMLSEIRKDKVFLIMAEQSTSQQKEPRLTDVTMANVGIVVCYRTANFKDEEIILNQFAPDVKRGEIPNLPQYHFYIKISSTTPEKAFSGQTILTQIKVDPKKVERFKNASRKNYASVYKGQRIQKPKKIVVNQNINQKTNNSSKGAKGDNKDSKNAPIYGALPKKKSS